MHHLSPRILALVLFSLLTACGPDPISLPPPIMDIGLTAVEPEVVLPGTPLVIRGSAFVPSFAGPSRLRFRGQLSDTDVDFSLPLHFTSYDRYEVDWPGAAALGLPTETGVLIGTANIEADNVLDGRVHVSGGLPIAMALVADLVPRLDGIVDEVLFVNDPILAIGGNFLLGGAEGHTVAVVQGSYTVTGSDVSTAVGPVQIEAVPFKANDRTRVVFPFAPSVAGIQPGQFSGSVHLINLHGALSHGVKHPTGPLPLQHEVIAPSISSTSPASASLGQFVDIKGGGFVGAEDGGEAVTTLVIDGDWTPSGQMAQAVQLELITDVAHGQLARYVMNEDDGLGQLVDLRKGTGTLVGTILPRTRYGTDTVDGAASSLSLSIAPIKQVVWLRFLPAYVESLRRFGLRAADTLIRERIIAVVRHAYGGINLEIRTEKPTDFKLVSEVEIAGPDPNGFGLIGYDNTPGKDDGNLRLYDKIGGVNALTQDDGYPGYGGIFVESLFGFSEHPQSLAEPLDPTDADFDRLFDTFRPDVSNRPIEAKELVSFSPLSSGDACPATARNEAIACAVWSLGSLIGTTVAHEIAHSLGLADPGGSGFHNGDDFPSALMDQGSQRSFRERAEIRGHSPGAFCAHNYAYLAEILPSLDPDPQASREECF